MFAFAARRPALRLTLLLLAGTGCSGGGLDQSQEAVQPSFEKLEDLGALCENPGEGYSEAAEYSGDGPHPTAMFTASSSADTAPRTEPSLISPHPGADEDATPIVSWFPDSIKESVLLVCAEGHGKKEKLRTCEYKQRSNSWDSNGSQEDTNGANSTLPLYSQDFSFTIYELATGRTLHESDFTATNGHFFGSGVTMDCPISLQYETFPTELYAAPSAEDVHEELGHVVEGESG